MATAAATAGRQDFLIPRAVNQLFRSRAGYVSVYTRVGGCATGYEIEFGGIRALGKGPAPAYPRDLRPPIGVLADSVRDRDYSQCPYERRNGYVFNEPDNSGIESAVCRAFGLWYSYTEEFRMLMVNGMRYDSSWNHPANTT